MVEREFDNKTMSNFLRVNGWGGDVETIIEYPGNCVQIFKKSDNKTLICIVYYDKMNDKMNDKMRVFY